MAAVSDIVGHNDSESAKERWDLYTRWPQNILVSEILDKSVMVFRKKTLENNSRKQSV